MVISESQTIVDFLDVLDELTKEQQEKIINMFKDVLVGDVFLENRNKKLENIIANSIDENSNDEESQK